jgi:pimeloyl-ACP methyl ester carboxylesterase
MARAREPVVLVHGLWMNGLEFGVLRQRLQAQHGFDVHVFPYSSMQGDPAVVAAELMEFTDRCAPGGQPVHLVGHSLGGAFVFRALENGLRERPGNAVLLGSPLLGSRAACNVARFTALRPLLGTHVLYELARPCERQWASATSPRALGAIAGTRRIGTGQFFARFDEDNDGTVGVSETRLPGLDDHLLLPHSHIGMLFAHDVATQVAHFLHHGRFARPAP